jgi:3-oxocholest-4-en-26-oate---CoA ligase
MLYTGGTTGMPKGVVWRHEDMFFAGMGGGNPVAEPVTTPEELAERINTDFQLTMFAAPPLMHGAAFLGTFIGFFQGSRSC